jgi:hypothetical protein
MCVCVCVSLGACVYARVRVCVCVCADVCADVRVRVSTYDTHAYPCTHIYIDIHMHTHKEMDSSCLPARKACSATTASTRPCSSTRCAAAAPTASGSRSKLRQTAVKAQRNVRPDGPAAAWQRAPRNVQHATCNVQHATCNVQRNPRGAHTRNPRRTAGACGEPQALAFALPTDHPHCAALWAHLIVGLGLVWAWARNVQRFGLSERNRSARTLRRGMRVLQLRVRVTAKRRHMVPH